MFSLPTTDELAERARLAFRRYLKGTDAYLWPNNPYASAKVIAGAVFEAFGFLAYVSKMPFAHLAPDVETLQLHGEEYGIPRKAASPARGKVTFTAAAAATIDAAAILERADGVRYRVVLGATMPGAGSIDLDVVATTDGLATNAIAGTSLAIISGVIGAADAEVAADGIVLGVDVEDIESWRQRILFRKRNPPHGGNPADYVRWTLELSGFTRAFIERRFAGAGSVRIFPLMDGSYPNGIPTAADVARLSDYLDVVAPAACNFLVAAPSPVPVNVTIGGLTPNTPAMREKVEVELRDMFARMSRVSGSDISHPAMPYLAKPESFSRSWIWQAIANTTGEERHVLSAPAADVPLAAGQIAVLGTVVFL